MGLTKKKGRKWYLSEIDFVLDNYDVMDTKLMSIELNRTTAAIKTIARKLGITKANFFDLHFTEYQLQQMRDLYPNTRTEDLANMIGKSKESVYRKANSMGLKKTEEYLQSESSKRFHAGHLPGKEFWFKKGQKPFNTGKKQHEYMSKEAIEKTAATRFKHGQKVWNEKPVGTIEFREAKVRLNRIEPGYYWIKVEEPNKWEPLHVHVWKQHFGAIPKGNIIVFKDKNVRICEVEYLECITREEHMLRNTIQRYPAEIKSAIRVISKLNKAIKKHENN